MNRSNCADSWSELDATISLVLYKTPPDEVLRAVDQIQASKLNTHIIIVDNSTPPVTLPKFPPEAVSIVHVGRNIGYGRAHNIAIRDPQFNARYHLVLNTDLFFDGAVLDYLVSFMDRNASVGLVMPKVRYPDGELQHLCRLLPTPMDLVSKRFLGRLVWARQQHRRYELMDWGYDEVASIPFLSGCFMMMRKSILDKVGGFDDRFFLYGEDTDLSRRMHMVSDTLYVPHVEVVHEYRSQNTRSWKQLKYSLMGLARYFFKWGWVFDRDRSRINGKCLEQLRTGLVTFEVPPPDKALLPDQPRQSMKTCV